MKWLVEMTLPGKDGEGLHRPNHLLSFVKHEDHFGRRMLNVLVNCGDMTSSLAKRYGIWLKVNRMV